MNDQDILNGTFILFIYNSVNKIKRPPLIKRMAYQISANYLLILNKSLRYYIIRNFDTDHIHTWYQFRNIYSIRIETF